MSQLQTRRSKLKKLEESFSDHLSDHHDDTQLQTSEVPNPIKSTKLHTKTQPRESKLQKKEEDYSKITENKSVKKLPFKTQDDQQKLEPRVKKYESVNPIKNFAEDDYDQEHKDSQPAKRSTRNQKKKQLNAEKLQENEQRTNQIIEKLDKAYDEDVELYKQGKPADKKLKCILQIQKQLKEVELSKCFLNMDGHLLFIEWLLPNSQTKQETSLTVKIHVLNLLADMRFSKENIEAGNELEKVVKKYRRSRFDTLRDLSLAIVEKWKIMRALPNA